jgi:hypothetical protein
VTRGCPGSFPLISYRIKYFQEVLNMAVKEKRIVIGVPHMGLFNWQTVMAYIGLAYSKDVIAKWHFVGSCLVYDAREHIVDFMYQQDADYILFLDSDMVPPSDMLQKMLEADVPIITGMAFKRTPPFQPCFYTTVKINKNFEHTLESPVVFPKEGLMEIQGCGLACCLVKREVFDAIERPYFFPLPKIGEDLTFCLKARKKGFKMFVDLSIDVGHVAAMPIVREHFDLAYQEYQNSGNKEPLFLDEEGR